MCPSYFYCVSHWVAYSSVYIRAHWMRTVLKELLGKFISFVHLNRIGFLLIFSAWLFTRPLFRNKAPHTSHMWFFTIFLKNIFIIFLFFSLWILTKKYCWFCIMSLKQFTPIIQLLDYSENLVLGNFCQSCCSRTRWILIPDASHDAWCMIHDDWCMTHDAYIQQSR